MTEGITETEVREEVLKWLPDTEGRVFDIEYAQRHFKIHGTNGSMHDKHTLAQVLSTLKRDGELGGDGRGAYRFVDRVLETLNWVDAEAGDILDIRWPYGWGDNTGFGFDDNIALFPGNIVTVAGISNAGKTTFMHNLLVLNLDSWENRGVRYLTNELNAPEFKDRMSHHAEHYELTDEFGEPRFEAATRYDNYQDVILPNGLNLIDWLDPGENPYFVGKQLKAISEALVGGVAFVAMQKKDIIIQDNLGHEKHIPSPYAIGGQYTVHLPRVVLHIEENYLYVKKVKKWRTENPNKKRFSFQIIDEGAHFYNIRPYVEGENG